LNLDIKAQEVLLGGVDSGGTRSASMCGRG
jgi:hypothetical protein